MSGGGGTTVQNAQPWSSAQPYLQDIMGQAQGLYNNGSQYYPGQTVAPFNPLQTQALDLTAQRALNGSPVINAADNSLMNILQPQQMPGQATLQSIMQQYGQPTAAQQYLGQQASQLNINPYLGQMFSAAAQPVTDAVNAEFGLGDRTGSGAHQQELTRNLGQLAANIYGTNYNQAVQNQQNAANSIQAAQNAQGQLAGTAAAYANSGFNANNGQRIAALTQAPSLAGQDYTDLQNLLTAGGAYQNQNQQNINAAIQQFNWGQTQPWNLLANYSGNVNGMGNLGSVTNTTQPGQSLVPSLLGAGVNLLAQPASGGGSLFSNLLGYGGSSGGTLSNLLGLGGGSTGFDYSNLASIP